MRYAIEMTRRANRDLAGLPVPDRRRVARRIEALADDPRPRGAQKLQALEDIYRIRSGSYRIIYRVRDQILVVLVLVIRHRGRVYEDLERLLKGQ